SLTLRYEDINDNSDLAANQWRDDRNVYSAILRHKYKPNTNLTLTYRMIDTNGDPNKTVIPAAKVLNSGYISTLYVPGLVADTVGDMSLLNLQLDINF
ncbi:MAG: hypothetical protein PHW04_15850, partial [Candidatus Wallbacteria bacterium]|nr:hypothetical protein [Candidatus Wallbacteria bacterium]